MVGEGSGTSRTAEPPPVDGNAELLVLDSGSNVRMTPHLDDVFETRGAKDALSATSHICELL